MANPENQEVTLFLAKMNGIVEALVYAYASLAVSIPQAAESSAILNNLLKPASITEGDTPTQKAYKDGMQEAISTLNKAVLLAKQSQELNQSQAH